MDLASANDDKEAKTFSAPKEGFANLYIFRKSIMGYALAAPVLINDRAIGSVRVEQFQKLTLPEGQYRLTTSDPFVNYKEGATIRLARGSNTYVETKVRPGLVRPKLQFKKTSEDEAQGKIQASKLTAHVSEPFPLPPKPKSNGLANSGVVKERAVSPSSNRPQTGSAVKKAATSNAHGGILGRWKDSQTSNVFVFRSGSGEFIQSKSINGNPGTVTTYFTWTLSADKSQVTIHKNKISLTGSAGYDQTRSISSSVTNSISAHGSYISINGVRFDKN